jgi:hypothetical protein
MLRPLCAAIALWFCISPCAAALRDGEALLQQCTATIGAQMDFCYGYVDAVADYLFQNNFMGEFRACVTTPPDDSQLRFAVVDFLQRNPALRGLGAPSLIARALSERYPCR